MKILLDFLPILLFFGTFKYTETHAQWAADFATQHFGFLVAGGTVGTTEAPVMLATLVVIVATVVQVLWLKLSRRKVDTMLWVSLTLVVVLGGSDHLAEERYLHQVEADRPALGHGHRPVGQPDPVRPQHAEGDDGRAGGHA